MDRIPEEDEEFAIDVDGYEFRILKVESRMIKSVLMTKLPEKTGAEQDTSESEEKESKSIQE